MSRQIVITYTPATPDYNPEIEGFRFARSPEEEGLQVVFSISTDATITEILDAVKQQTDPIFRRPLVAGMPGQVFSAIPTAPPVRVGDTVSVDGLLMACEKVGWVSPKALLDMEEDEV